MFGNDTLLKYLLYDFLKTAPSVLCKNVGFQQILGIISNTDAINTSGINVFSMHEPLNTFKQTLIYHNDNDRSIMIPMAKATL